jgi:DNA-binding MarR family transcriptional regulator
VQANIVAILIYVINKSGRAKYNTMQPVRGERMPPGTVHQIDPIESWEITLRTVTGLMRIYSQKMQAEVEIPLTWFDVLVQLYEAPDGRLRMQDLAELVILSPSGLTRVVDRIEKAGLVRRKPSTKDRRETFVLLTKTGHAMAHRAREAHHRHIKEHFLQHLTDDDIQALHITFSNVRRNLPATSPEGQKVRQE